MGKTNVEAWRHVRPTDFPKVDADLVQPIGLICICVVVLLAFLLFSQIKNFDCGSDIRKKRFRNRAMPSYIWIGDCDVESQSDADEMEDSSITLFLPKNNEGHRNRDAIITAEPRPHLQEILNSEVIEKKSKGFLCSASILRILSATDDDAAIQLPTKVPSLEDTYVLVDKNSEDFTDGESETQSSP